MLDQYVHILIVAAVALISSVFFHLWDKGRCAALRREVRISTLTNLLRLQIDRCWREALVSYPQQSSEFLLQIVEGRVRVRASGELFQLSELLNISEKALLQLYVGQLQPAERGPKLADPADK